MKQNYIYGDVVKIVKVLDGLTSKDLIGFVGRVREVDELPNGEHNYDVDGHYMHEAELEKYETTRKIKLKDHVFFKDFVNPGMIYQGESTNKELKIAVQIGRFDDWAAYYETPYCRDRVLAPRCRRKWPSSFSRK